MKNLKYNTRAVLLVLLMIVGASNASAMSVSLSTSVSTVGVGQEILLVAKMPAFDYDYWCTYTFQYYTDESSNLVTINTQTERNPNVNYGFHPTQAGTYHFRVTATYSNASSTSATSGDDVTVTVVNPTVSIAAAEETVDAGSNIVLTATPEYGTPKTYTFLYSDDGGDSYEELAEGSSNTATYMPTQAGTYLFRVITSDGTHIASSDPVEVTATAVDPYVIFSVTPTTTNTKGTIELTAVPVCCKPTAYYFRRISGSTAMLINSDLTSNVCTYVQGDPGTYTFSVTAYYDEDKSVSATSGEITVLPMAQGDVNEDEKVSIADVALLVEILQKKRPSVYGADVNRDGSVNTDDVKAVVNLILYGTIDDPNSIDYEGSNKGDDLPKEAETKGETF